MINLMVRLQFESFEECHSLLLLVVVHTTAYKRLYSLEAATTLDILEGFTIFAKSLISKSVVLQ